MTSAVVGGVGGCNAPLFSLFYKKKGLVYSDDHGDTWKFGGVGPPGTRESEVAQIPSATGDAALYMNARNFGETPGHRYTAACTKGGEVCSNYALDQSLTSPITPHWTGIVDGVLAVPGSKLVFSGIGDTTVRANMTLRTSVDNGKSWSAATAVYDGPAAYSDIALADEKTVIVIYENGVKTFADRVSVSCVSLITL